MIQGEINMKENTSIYISLIIPFISLIVTIFLNFSLYVTLFVFLFFFTLEAFIIYIIKYREKSNKTNSKIPCVIIVILVLIFATSLMNEFVGVSYIIQISHDGEYTGGFGSEHLTIPEFTEYAYKQFNLGNTNYIDVGAKKSTDNLKAIKLKILKKRMINIFGDEKLAENVTSTPYGEVVLNIET